MTPLNSSLETVLKTALLGTGREGSPTQLEGALRPFGEAQGGAEKTLLSAATATIISARAGQLPTQSKTEEIALCPPETQAYFSQRAASLLDSCLAGQRELIPQALSWAAQSGQIAPPGLLPRLLELGKGSREIRPQITAILGERGRWLAQLNPDWQQVAAPLDADLETSWQEGEIAARREALRLKREQNPTEAREWVQTIFPSEGAKERTRWLETLEVQLSQDDEPFLESALTDKSKEVRAVAVSLLERLPASRLVARAKAELEPLLKWNGTTQKLEVELPAAWKKKWAQDGLEEKVSPYNRVRNLGEKASWVRQWLTRVPPSHWEMTWNAMPAVILAGVPKEWREMLVSAWWDAAKLSGDTTWLLALLAASDAETIRRHFGFHGITAEQSDSLALALWEKGDQELSSATPLANLLLSHPGPWSVPLARRFLKVAREEMERGHEQGGNNLGRYNWLRSTLPALGDKFPTEMVTEATLSWPDDIMIQEHWLPVINQFLTRLQLRADLQAEFKNPTL